MPFSLKKRSHALLFALTLLAACGQDSPAPSTQADQTFSIRLDPAVLNLRVTETGSVKVMVSRSGGFADPVTITLGGESTGLEATPLNITGTEGTLKIRASDLAKLGSSFPLVRAEGGGLSKTETLTLKLTGAVATAASIALRDNAGSPQVRQGSGSVVLDINGGNLDRVTAFKLGDLTLGVLAGRTAAHLALEVGVPDGAAPGARTLLMTAAGGDTAFPSALIVTAITSGPAGNDSSGAGTTDRPYRTLGKALSLAHAGDTARLLNGSYTAAGGEHWPLVSAGGLPPNVPAGVSIEGESVAGTILDGPGAGSPNVALAFTGDGGARSLTVRNFVSGFVVTTGTVTLGGTLTEKNGIGLSLGGGTATVRGAEFRANGTGIIAVSAGTLNLSGGSSHDNSGDGVRLGDGAPTLRASDFEAFGNQSGVIISGGGSALLERVKLHDNRDHGLMGTQQSGIVLNATQLYANAQAGLWFSGKTLTLRDSVIRDNANFGLYVEGVPARVDLGSFTQAGLNDLHGNGPNGSADQILDVRPDRGALGDPDAFTLSATLLNGLAPTADVYPGDGKWPYLNSPYFSILGKNNVIRVYP